MKLPENKKQKSREALQAKIAKYEAELEKIHKSIIWRWGETRRFHSNARKIERRNRLISKLAELRVRINNLI